ncbi:MAG: tRNA lysidine(34) synthetase TilS [Bacteroidia bacterium]|nr:tRNA lysidine(34) synthetase TilS [Bacteroidia bacterium]
MKQAFELHIGRKKLFSKKDNLLLALSGGADSVVLAHLLVSCGFKVQLAHCNFNLRGSESHEDERFCSTLAKQLQVPIHITHFDTKALAKTKKISLQMAARELRYNWFNQLLAQHGLKYLLTAHHANDVTETQLINLLRGTGIKGLKGISEKRNNILRPLLPFTKQQIEDFAKTTGYKFRVDQSNFDDKYERNFLRLNVIPLLKKINPQLENTFCANAQRFAQEEALLEEIIEQKKEKFVSINQNNCHIKLSLLKKETSSHTLLYHFLLPYGFNETQVTNMLQPSASESGQLFNSPSHRATINRSTLIVNPITPLAQAEMVLNSLQELKKLPQFSVSELKTFAIPAKNELILLPQHLVFPLRLRKKQSGEKFKPFGLKHFKLLSDFFREEKMSAFEKENCLLLVNGNNDIIWVPGHRSDERYRVPANAKAYLKLTWHGE